MDLLKKGSLFKQSKGDADFVNGQVRLREGLMKKLSRSIKEVQLQFTTQEGGGAIGDSRSALGLCGRFEDILRHGLKAKWFSQGNSTTFWPVILKISRKQAIAYINGLQYAQTENGKCRAWIRLAVNECSLESYIHVLCQDAGLLSQHYEGYSFLRDSDSVTTLTQLLAGVAEVTFNLTVNTASLEFGDAPEAYQPTLKLKIPVSTSHKSKEAKAKHGKDQKTNHHSSKTEQPSRAELPPAGNPEKRETSSTPTAEIEESSSFSSEASSSFTGHHSSSTAGLKPGMALVQYSPSVSPGEESEGDGRIETLEQEYGNEEVETLDPECQSGGEGGGTEEFEPEYGDVAVAEGTGESVLSVSPIPDVNGMGVFQDFDSYVQHDENSLEPTKETEVDPYNHDLRLEECNNNNDAISNEEDSATTQPPSVALTDPIPNNPFTDDPILEPPSTSEEAVPSINRRSTNPFLPQYPASKDNEATFDPTFGASNPFSGSDDEDDSNVETPLVPSNPFLDHTNPFQSDCSDREAEGGTAITESQVERALVESEAQPVEGLVCNDEVCVLPPARTTRETGTETQPQQKRFSNPFSSPSPPPPLLVGDISDKSLLPDLSSPHIDWGGASASDHAPYHYHAYEDEFASNQTTPSSATPSDTKTTTTPSEYDVNSLDLSMALENAFDLSRRLSSLDSAQLQPKEDHFGTELSVRDLEVAIADLKLRLSSASSGAADGGLKHELRKKIVLLQMALHRMREEEESRKASDQEVLGHNFARQPLQIRLTGALCEGCSRRVRGISRSWYLCQNCQSACHEKCLGRVTRMCIASKEDKDYIFTVCPEKGLTVQYFRCASCNQAFNDQATKTRLCDYSGLYYCPSCHHNDEAIIPARVVHNWDFNPRKVCCRCSDLLSRLYSRPLVSVGSLNPLLYTYVQDLVTVESLRRDLLHMKDYFLQCRRAKESHLLQRLDRFPHFKENNKLFSLQDLVSVFDNKLLPELNEIYSEFAHHIREDCPLCAGKGFFCELCNTDEIIYPFDRHVRICPHCSSVYHKTCYAEMVICPKCQRTKTKKKRVPRS